MDLFLSSPASRSKRSFRDRTGGLRARRQVNRRRLILEALEDRRMLATVSWDGEAGDLNWNSALNWNTDQLPTSADDVVIDVPGDIAVRHSGGTTTIKSLQTTETLAISGGIFEILADSEVASLELSGGTLNVSAGLGLNGRFDWSRGTLTGDGQTTVRGFMQLRGYDNQLKGHMLNNSGLATVGSSDSSFDLKFFDGAVFNNLAGALVDIQFDRTAFSRGTGGGVFNNFGTVYSVRGGNYFDIVFNNTGRVEVVDGTLSLYQGGMQSGDFQIGSQATLVLGGNHTFQAGSSITGGGTLSVGGATFAGDRLTVGTLSVNGLFTVNGADEISFDAIHVVGQGILDLSSGHAHSVESVTLDNHVFVGATLTGSDDITVTGLTSFSNGTLGGTGVFNALGGMNLRGPWNQLKGRTLNNSGSATLTVGSGNSSFHLEFFDGAVFNNLAGALVDIQVGSTFSRGTGGGVFNNFGTLRKSAAEGSASLYPVLNNSGTIEVQNGALTIGGGGTQSGTVLTRRGAELNISTNLFDLGRGRGVSGPGTLRLSGVGSESTPQQLEVMSRDDGNVPFDFTRGFALDRLLIENGSHVQLVDVSDNSSGTDAEALYLSSLSVSANSTLDLNLFHVYTRQSAASGTVLGGAVNPVPDGGLLKQGLPTPGAIANSNEVDQWTFFGRAGQGVTVIANPGTNGSLNPLDPTLDFVDVQILDPNGAVVASGQSNVAGEIITLLGVQLSETGNYTIRIAAPNNQPDARGNYILSAWNSTVNVSPLVLNQQVFGGLDTQYSVDRWTFTATENEQIQFDLVAASSADLRFKLSGPNEWVGFTDQGADSELINLPETGIYMLEAFSVGTEGGSYSFQLRESSQTELTLGTTYAGSFIGSGQAQLFHVNIPEQDNLIVVLDDVFETNRNELYVKRGTPPTRTNYDYRFNAIASADQKILASTVPAGDWYVLVYSEATVHAGIYTLLATTEDIAITSVTPNRHGDSRDVTLTVSGLGFNTTSKVELVSADDSVYAGTPGLLVTPTRITTTFAAGSVPMGVYTVRVTKDGSEPAIFPSAFEITVGSGGVLETNLVLPTVVGRHALATIYVEYSNTGSSSMPAPLLLLKSSPAAYLTLDQSQLVEGLWTLAQPDGFSDTVQILASGKTPGLLNPGETARVPVYYAGQPQTSWGENSILFDLSITTVDQPDLIDWDAFREETRITAVSDEAWDALWLNVVDAVGTTWGDYVRMLDDNARYLSELGQTVIDVRDLWWFEVQQAYGFRQLALQENVVDSRLATPGLPLTFDRYYSGCLLGRNDITSFGRGWFDSWDTSFNVEQDGTVDITTPRGFHRRFQPDARRSNTYFSQDGDQATLESVPGGAFLLREADGIATRYLADGQLNYWEDTNGNRITAGYAGERLTSLTHSSGQWLQFTYNNDGFIETVADSDGRTTTFGYDGDLLTSVIEPDGQTTQYVYATSNDPRLSNALLEVHSPTENFFYSYDSHGRLNGITRDGGAVPFTIAYDSAGKVSMTDAVGATTEYYYDYRGELAAVRDPLLSTTFFEHDDDLQLTSITDAAGQVTKFAYDVRGNLIQTTDALGNTKSFSYAGPFNKLVAARDANGIITQYDYDDAGNLVAIKYVDKSVEKFAYDPQGSVKATTNRRGEPVAYTRDDAGRIVRKTYPDGSTDEFVYDANNGNLIEVRDAHGITTLEYSSTIGDQLLTKIVYPKGRFLQYQYDTAGRRIQMVDQDSYQVNYSYNELGRLKDLKDGNGSEIASYTYDVAGRLSRKDLANSTYTTYDYDELDRLIRMFNHAPDGSVNSFFEYAYDEVLLRSSMNTKEGLWTYQFDAIGQLTSAVFQSNDPAQIPHQNLTYEYDAMGNRVRTVRNGLTTDYSSNDLNQYETVGSATYVYDADGNLVRKVDGGEITSFVYNVDNRLVAVSSPSGTWEYEYDALGNRIATTYDGQRTDFVVDPFGYGNMVAEFDESGLVSRYTYGIGGLTSRLDANGTAYSYDTDEIGTVVGLTDGSGVYGNSYMFDPFGEVLSQSGSLANPFLFAGAHGIMADESGLYYMRNRFYDSINGRFTSPDPLRSAGDNSYSYVGNNPLQYLDPLGLKKKTYRRTTRFWTAKV